MWNLTKPCITKAVPAHGFFTKNLKNIFLGLPGPLQARYTLLFFFSVYKLKFDGGNYSICIYCVYITVNTPLGNIGEL
jgi:hypothetical protein